MASTSPVVHLAIEAGIAIITIDSPPVNALSQAVREGLFEALSRALADDAARAIVILCAGRTFIAGADIKELGKPKQPPRLLDIQDRIETAPKPIIAAMHGAALGGGLELALCAHYRLATPSTKLGLPEVMLGLLPGAGGTQRLPRAIGVSAALEWMTSGRHVTAVEALHAGLLDAVVEAELKAEAIAFAQRISDGTRPLRRVRDDASKLALPDPGQFFARFRKDHRALLAGYKAPEAIIQSVEAAVRLDWNAAIETERRLFAMLLETPEAAAQRYGFTAERRSRTFADVEPGPGSAEPSRVMLVGDGPLAAEARHILGQKGCLVRTRVRSASDPRETQQPPNVILLAGATEREKADALEMQGQRGGAILEMAEPPQAWSNDGAPNGASAVICMFLHKPVGEKRLLEVRRGYDQHPTSLAAAFALGRLLNATAVAVGADGPLPSHRLLMRIHAEIERCCREHISVERVDHLLDRFGLHPRFLKPKLARTLPNRTIDTQRDEDILAEILHPLVDESVRLIAEGLVRRGCDIDMIWLNGLGWPPYRGGALWYGDHIGPQKILTTLSGLTARRGGYHPSPLLTAAAISGAKLTDLGAA